MPRSARKESFYAVARGRARGVYTTWDDAKKQVQNFGGAMHKVRRHRTTTARATRDAPSRRRERAGTNFSRSNSRAQKFATLDEARAYLEAHRGDDATDGGVTARTVEATRDDDGIRDGDATESARSASEDARGMEKKVSARKRGTSGGRGMSTRAGEDAEDGIEARVRALASAANAPKEDRSEDEYVLEFDGASRGNPGEAGAGALLRRKRDDRIVEELLEYLGNERTVNEAEYAALCLGLRKAVELGITKIEVRGDSKLIVNQVEGSFKLKSANLKSMHAEACELKEKFTEFKISHVKREFNKHADHLANMAVDFGLSPSRMSGDASTSATKRFESGGGGLGGGGDDADAKRRKLGGEQRYARLFRSFAGGAAAAPTRLGRGYHAYARASVSHDGEASNMASGAPLVVGGGASRVALASARRSWIPLTRAAMGFARLRL